MKRLALVLLAFASTGFMGRVPPVLPSELVQPRRATHPMIIGPSTPMRKQKHGKDTAPLAAKVASAKGLARVEAIDALTYALEDQDVPDADLEAMMDRVAKLYATLLAESALEQSPHADELLLRIVKGVRDEELAFEACERLLEKFPASRFAVDAHLALAQMLEYRGDYVFAKPHLLAAISSGQPAFANHARLRLGWLLDEAQQYAASVSELAVLSESDDAAVADAAIDLLAIPYARVGRADLAAAMFDRIDRSKSAARLRSLAFEYADQNKFAEVIVVLRDAIARDRDPKALCLDRADIVAALAATKNRRDLGVAIAELADAQRISGSCKPAADDAIARTKRP